MNMWYWVGLVQAHSARAIAAQSIEEAAEEFVRTLPLALDAPSPQKLGVIDTRIAANKAYPGNQISVFSKLYQVTLERVGEEWKVTNVSLDEVAPAVLK